MGLRPLTLPSGCMDGVSAVGARFMRLASGIWSLPSIPQTSTSLTSTGSASVPKLDLSDVLLVLGSATVAVGLALIAWQLDVVLIGAAMLYFGVRRA